MFHSLLLITMAPAYLLTTHDVEQVLYVDSQGMEVVQEHTGFL